MLHRRWHKGLGVGRCNLLRSLSLENRRILVPDVLRLVLGLGKSQLLLDLLLDHCLDVLAHLLLDLGLDLLLDLLLDHLLDLQLEGAFHEFHDQVLLVGQGLVHLLLELLL